MCGTGIATSTVVTGKVRDWLKDNNLEDKVQLFQSKITDELNRLDDYDIVVSTTLVPDNVRDKVIDGVPLLTGFGTEEMYGKILELINS